MRILGKSNSSLGLNGFQAQRPVTQADRGQPGELLALSVGGHQTTGRGWLDQRLGALQQKEQGLGGGSGEGVLEDYSDLADGLLCPSEFVVKTFLDRGASPEHLVRHIYGYDEQRFRPIQAGDVAGQQRGDQQGEW